MWISAARSSQSFRPKEVRQAKQVNMGEEGPEDGLCKFCLVKRPTMSMVFNWLLCVS